MYSQFQHAYYGREQAPILSPSEFRDKAPIIVFDVSKQEDRINSNVVDCRVEIASRINIPARTYAFCLILHDRMVSYNCRDNTVKLLT